MMIASVTGDDFVCHSCGRCCGYIKLLTELYDKLAPIIGEEHARFPYRIIDGRCEMLGEDNRCSVYAERPILCDVRGFAKLLAEKTNQDPDVMIAYAIEGQKKICNGQSYP